MRMHGGAFLLVAAVIAFSGHAQAAEIKAKGGQVFCARMEDLHAYLIALIKKDIKAASQYNDCGGVPEGTHLVILENMPTASPIGHVAKVKALLPDGGGSLVGYTLILNP